MGVKALTSHSQSKGHQKLVKKKEEVTIFLKKKGETASKGDVESEISEVTVQQSCSKKPINSLVQNTIPSIVQDGGKINAEVRWYLKHVLSGYSNNSVCNSPDSFEVMFPDSKIASQMELGRIKLMYIENFGMAPYFREILKNETVNSGWYTISFDASLIKVVQECEMDIIIRFWDNLSNKVQVRFWNSMFFGHSTSADLLKHFADGLSGLDPSKNLQISVDGPNVNLKFLKGVKKRNRRSKTQQVNGHRALYMYPVHGAFKSACEKTDWGLKSLIKGAFHLLKDSPACREDKISITGSSVFHLQFCATR